jgi:hypothetical protein
VLGSLHVPVDIPKVRELQAAGMGLRSSAVETGVDIMRARCSSTMYAAEPLLIPVFPALGSLRGVGALCCLISNTPTLVSGSVLLKAGSAWFA